MKTKQASVVRPVVPDGEKGLAVKRSVSMPEELWVVAESMARAQNRNISNYLATLVREAELRAPVTV